MMGKPGSLLRELTETRERALAWLFRAALAVILVLGTGLVSLSTYFVYDLRQRSEQIEIKQNDIANRMGVFNQLVVDRTQFRDHEVDIINRRLDTLESKVK